MFSFLFNNILERVEVKLFVLALELNVSTEKIYLWQELALMIHMQKF